MMTPRSRNDAEVTAWALEAGQGDRTALERLIASTQRDLWRYMAYWSSPATAEDLTQETYLRALRTLHKFSARSSARTWLFAIARRVVADHIRRVRAEGRHALLDDDINAAEHHNTAAGFDERIALTDLLRYLTTAQRDAFLLTQIAGLSYAEAAQACGCPVGTIRSRVARARGELIDLCRASKPGNATRSAG